MFSNIIGAISGFMYSKLLIILLLGGGIYFTVATKFIQGRMFKEAISVIGEKPTKEGAVSSFQALMVSTASRVGTGNIVGVASAIGLGGYGAVFWMWLIAIVGGASAFVESTLAQIYKKKDDEGNYYGGPAYYIEAALHSRALAFLFAFSMLLTYAGGFNMLCAYNLQSTFSAYSFYDPKVSPIIIGAILAIIFGYCLLGGGKRIVKTTSTLVPIMGILYVLVSLFVLLTHANLIPEVFARIFAEAFDFQAIFGGFAGSCVMFGIKRGLYSNEAGV
ncbi:MAG: alanine/glycine:cation symporter family protein, partial [Lachnospiraceae bacterium]